MPRRRFALVCYAQASFSDIDKHQSDLTERATKRASGTAKLGGLYVSSWFKRATANIRSLWVHVHERFYTGWTELKFRLEKRP